MKPSKSKLEITSPLFQIIFISLIILLLAEYFILTPNKIEESLSLSQTKEFANFIETRPDLAEANPSAVQKIEKPLVLSKPTNEDSSANPSILRPMSTQERFEVANIEKSWQNPKHEQPEEWKSQVERLFEIAEHTHDPDLFELVKREIVRSKNNPDPLTERLLENWRARYFQLDNSRAAHLELE